MLRRTRGPYSVRFRPHEPAANAMGAGGSVQLGGDAVDADAAKLAFSAICDELKDPSTGKVDPEKLRAYAAQALGGPRKVPIGYNNPQGTAIEISEMALADGRQRSAKIGPNGFQLVAFDHGIADFTKGDETQKEITEKLYPKLEALLLAEMAGAKKVKVFNHGLRASTVANPPPAAAVNAPVKEAHSDFSATIAPQAAAKVAADAGLELTERYCLVNLWMSVDFANPIMTTPLAFLDHGSVAPGDVLDNYALTGGGDAWSGNMERRYRALIVPNEKHDWVYFPKMVATEAVIFKQFDSTTSESTVCIHAACKCDEGPPPLPPRQSVEVRALVLY